jgi:hypothetical protein
METEFVHFTKGGILYHAYYEKKVIRYGIHWFKVPGSEEKCQCPDRESDRKSLMDIREE